MFYLGLRRDCRGVWSVAWGIGMTLLIAGSSAATLDSSFQAAPNGPVSSLIVQPGGKIIVGGSFTAIAGASRSYLARLNANGTLDTSFAPASSPAQPVFGVATAAGKLYVGAGDGLRRYDTNGTQEWLYPMAVKAFAVDSAQRVVIGGQFTRANGQYHRNIARLDASGLLDASFTAAIGCCAADGAFALLNACAGVIVGGAFQTVNASNAASNLALIGQDGAMDAGFSAIADPTVLALAATADGKFIRVSERTVARHLAGGAPDPAFTPLHTTSGDDHFTIAAVQSDGTTIVGGSFTVGSSTHLARLSADGTQDGSFGIKPDGAVQAIAIQPDGNILIGGSFNNVNGSPSAGMARINAASASTTSSPPALHITVGAPGQLVLSWSGSSSFVLEAADLNSTAWSAVTAPVTSTNGVNSVTVAAGGPGRIYRLRAQ